jgi:hypothetical protein
MHICKRKQEKLQEVALELPTSIPLTGIFSITSILIKFKKLQQKRTLMK